MKQDNWLMHSKRTYAIVEDTLFKKCFELRWIMTGLYLVITLVGPQGNWCNIHKTFFIESATKQIDKY